MAGRSRRTALFVAFVDKETFRTRIPSKSKFPSASQTGKAMHLSECIRRSR